MLQYFCHAELLFNLSAQAFSPPPKVMSSFIRLTPKNEPEVKVDNLQNFEEIVRLAFQQRRKTIHNSLKKHVPHDLFESLDLDPQLRPEQLTVADFARISNACQRGEGG